MVVFLFTLLTTVAFAQTATVDVNLVPEGKIRIKSSNVRGWVSSAYGIYRAENIMVGLRDIRTGNAVCDKQTKKILQTWKYRDAVLVSAVGQDGKGTGVLKIRGIAKNIEGSYQVNGDSLTATFPIKLSDFNIDRVTYAGIAVEDSAIINITLPIKKNKLTPASRVH